MLQVQAKRTSVTATRTHAPTSLLLPSVPFNSAGTFPSVDTHTPCALFCLSTQGDGMAFDQPGPCVGRAKCHGRLVNANDQRQQEKTPKNTTSEQNSKRDEVIHELVLRI